MKRPSFKIILPSTFNYDIRQFEGWFADQNNNKHNIYPYRINVINNEDGVIQIRKNLPCKKHFTVKNCFNFLIYICITQIKS